MTRTLDLVPLQRFAVGFDQLFNEIDRLYSSGSNNNSYPPYNIIRVGEDSFKIEIAVAGFSENDLNVTIENGQLVIAGNITDRDVDRNYLHRGIGNRSFTRSFRLADHIEVVDATLKNGLLVIDLNRIVPEELKARKISIKS
jgi:molecular chaperone IbpA